MYYVGVGCLVHEMDVVRFVNWESQLGYLEVYGSGLHMLHTARTTAVRGSTEQMKIMLYPITWAALSNVGLSTATPDGPGVLVHKSQRTCEEQGRSMKSFPGV